MLIVVEVQSSRDTTNTALSTLQSYTVELGRPGFMMGTIIKTNEGKIFMIE